MLVRTENAGLENSGLENAGTSCAWVAKCNIINVRGHVRVNVTAYLSISRSIDGGRAFSTLEIWSCVFQSREFHPCDLVPRFPVLRFPPSYFSWSRVFQSRVFSVPMCCTVGKISTDIARLLCDGPASCTASFRRH